MNSGQICHCPECRAAGTPVPDVTVRAMVVDEARSKLRDTAYFLCTDSECPVAYFASEEVPVLTTADIRVPLHVKTDAHKRYACYCNKITEDEVAQAVTEKQLDKMQAIIRLLRGEAQSDCKHKNPFGRCCTERFHQLIDQAKTPSTDVEES